MIKNTVSNRKILRAHAKEAMLDYSPIMTWLVCVDGDLHIVVEPQGQSFYCGAGRVIGTTGSVYKAHGQGAETDEMGNRYKSQKAYLFDLLGSKVYNDIFANKE